MSFPLVAALVGCFVCLSMSPGNCNKEEVEVEVGRVTFPLFLFVYSYSHLMCVGGERRGE